ncbi:MAG: hypothetical protein DDT34_02309 [Firmicutes bacterium]|nr:hypothetical protein [Bacillota bacterium]
MCHSSLELARGYDYIGVEMDVVGVPVARRAAHVCLDVVCSGVMLKDQGGVEPGGADMAFLTCEWVLVSGGVGTSSWLSAVAVTCPAILVS